VKTFIDPVVDTDEGFMIAIAGKIIIFPLIIITPSPLIILTVKVINRFENNFN
jgi:hypothetical protein